jgi:hypothetical protein
MRETKAMPTQAMLVHGASPGRRLLHFLLLGCLLFAIEAVATRWIAEDAVEEIAVTHSQIETLRRDFRSRAGTLPDERELAALIRDHVDREILFREALRHDLHRTDPVVRRRLVRNVRFAEANASRGSDAFETALALGMERSDIVARRRLVQRAERMLIASARLRDPSPAELAAYLESHTQAYLRPARYRFAHVFLSADRRGADLERDATRLLIELRRQGRGPDEAAPFGDPLPLPNQLGPWSQREIAKQLGPVFARAIEDLETGRWTGPVTSAYGRHLVWILELTPPTLPSLEEVRGRVSQALREKRERGALRAGLQLLRRHYSVRVARGEPEVAEPSAASASAPPGGGSAS